MCGRRPGLLALVWLVAWAGCGWFDREPSAEEKQAKELLSRRLSVEGFERRLLATRECEGCSLAYAELAGADLRNAKLKGAGFSGNLRGVDFRGADLTEAAFSADLTGADFRGANIKDTHFGGSKLRGARFDGLDLRSVINAEGVDWSGAILRGVNLEEVTFHGLFGIYERTRPTHPLDPGAGGTHLNGTDLRGANLRGAVLSKCDLRGADLRGADLTYAVMPSMYELQQAQLGGAIAPDGRRCAEGSVGRCIAEGKPLKGQRRVGKN